MDWRQEEQGQGISSQLPLALDASSLGTILLDYSSHWAAPLQFQISLGSSNSPSSPGPSVLVVILLVPRVTRGAWPAPLFNCPFH